MPLPTSTGRSNDWAGKTGTTVFYSRAARRQTHDSRIPMNKVTTVIRSWEKNDVCTWTVCEYYNTEANCRFDLIIVTGPSIPLTAWNAKRFLNFRLTRLQLQCSKIGSHLHEFTRELIRTFLRPDLLKMWMIFTYTSNPVFLCTLAMSKPLYGMNARFLCWWKIELLSRL